MLYSVKMIGMDKTKRFARNFINYIDGRMQDLLQESKESENQEEYLVEIRSIGEVRDLVLDTYTPSLNGGNK